MWPIPSQGRPFPFDGPLDMDRTGSGGPSSSVHVPLGWAASIWRTPSPVPWPFNIAPVVSPPVSPSSPRSFDSGFGLGLPFLSGTQPGLQDLMRQSSLGDEVLSPNWRPGSALQTSLSGGFESGFGATSPGHGLTRQSSLEEGAISPSWRPGSAFQPVFPAGQVPGFFPVLSLTQDSSEGSPHGRPNNPGQVIARPVAITPQVPFTLERVLAAQQQSRALEGLEEGLGQQGFEAWDGGKRGKEGGGEVSGRSDGGERGGVSGQKGGWQKTLEGVSVPGDGAQKSSERSGSVDWSRFEEQQGSLDHFNTVTSSRERISNPILPPIDTLPGKLGSGFQPNLGSNPPFMVDSYPDAASLQQAAYEEEQRRVIQANWPYSPPQPSNGNNVAGTRGSQEGVPTLTLPPSVNTQSDGVATNTYTTPGSSTALTGAKTTSVDTAVQIQPAGVNKPAPEQQFLFSHAVRSVKSLPVGGADGGRGRKKKAARSASDSSAELRKTNSQLTVHSSSPSSGDTPNQEPTPQATPLLRPIQVKPILPTIEVRGSSFYPTRTAFFQPLKPQPEYPSPLLRVRLSDLVPRDGSASESHEFAVRNLAASLQNANAAVLQLRVEDAKLVREGLAALRLYFEGRRQEELSKVREGSTEGYEADGFVRRGKGVAFFHRAGRWVRSFNSVRNDVFANAYLCFFLCHLREDAFGLLRIG
jgi:hypothetical protein